MEFPVAIDTSRITLAIYVGSTVISKYNDSNWNTAPLFADFYRTVAIFAVSISQNGDIIPEADGGAP